MSFGFRKRKKKGYAISPVSDAVSGLTKDKEYKITKYRELGLFDIKNDTGHRLLCKIYFCQHIQFLSWTIINR